MGVSWGASRRPLATFSLRHSNDAATAPRRGLLARVARRGATTSRADASLGDDEGPAVVRRSATSARPFRNQEKDPAAQSSVRVR